MDALLLHPPERLNHEASTDQSLPKPNFESLLSNEIWDMIFEYADILQGRVLPCERFSSIARLVSKRFNSVAVPIAYRTFQLSPKLIASYPESPDPASAHISAIIRAHTKVISIGMVLDWDSTVKFLSGCKVFQDLRWSPSHDIDPSLPRPIQIAFQQHWPHVRLHLHQRCDPDGEVLTVDPETIPALNLSTLEVWECDTVKGGVTPDLNALVAAAKRLEILHVYPLTSYHFSAAYGKLPPIKELKLCGSFESDYESIDELDEIWDFSQLLSLEFYHYDNIVDWPTTQTLKSLRTLEIVGIGCEKSRQEKRSASARVPSFVQKLENLEDANIPTWYPTEIVKSLSSHGQSLRKLALSTMESTSSEPDYHHDQWLDADDVVDLCDSCPNLVDLRLDLNTPQREHREETFRMDFILRIIRILASLTSLRKVVLQYSLYNARGFYNRDFGPQIIEHFTRLKRGTPRQELVVHIQSRDHPREIQYSGNYIFDASGQLESYWETVFPDDIQDLLGEVETAEAVDAE